MKVRFGLFILWWFGGLVSGWGDSVMTNLTDLRATRIELSETGNFGFGRVVSGAGDFDGDGFRDIAISAPSFDRGGFDEGFDNGAVFVIPGTLLETDDTESTHLKVSSEGLNYRVFFGLVESGLGLELAAVGDVNRDGFSDLAVATERGSIGVVLLGRASGNGVVSLKEPSGREITLSNAGRWVAPAGDVNGDGFSDMLFGMPHSENPDKIGAVLIWGASDCPLLLDVATPGPTHRIVPFASNQTSVISAFGLDIDQDGFSDLGLLSPVPGKPPRLYLSFIPGSSHTNGRADPGWNYRFGGDSIRPAGDLNGDGFTDYVVGVSDSTNAPHSVRIYFGGEFRSPYTFLAGLSEWTGKDSTRIFGSDQAYGYGVGDLNGDGMDDLAVAMPDAIVSSNQADQVLAGRVLFLLGRSNWPHRIDVASLLRGESVEMETIKHFAALKPDLILLQESPLPQLIEALIPQHFPDFGYERRGDSTILARGTITAASPEISPPPYCLPVRVQQPDRQAIHVICLHLIPPTIRYDLWNPLCWREVSDNRQKRRQQMAEIVRYLDTIPSEERVIVGGDFNAPANDAVFRLLRPRLFDGFNEAGIGWGNTMLNDLPLLRFDQIWLSKQFQISVVKAFPSRDSDHRYVVCDVKDHF